MASTDQAKPKMLNEAKGILLASVTAFLWGFLAIGLKVMVQKIPTINIIWARFLIAFLILMGYFLIFDRPKLKIIIKPPLMLVGAAFLLTINYYGFNEGINYTTPANAQVFIQSGAILLVVFGIVFFKEQLKLLQIVGFMVAITGFVFFYFEQVSIQVADIYNKGILMLFMGGLSWAIFSSFQKILVRTYHAQQLNLFIYLVPSIICVPFVKFGAYTGLSGGMWVLLVALGINTLVAYGCLSLALKYIEANKVSIIITLNPVITFVAMAILDKYDVRWISPETYTWMTILGGMLVLAGAVIVLSVRKKAPREKS